MSESKVEKPGVYEVSLPLDKIKHFKVPSSLELRRPKVALVATGSFNPPTFMHLQMFELGSNALLSHGFDVIGGYMSPVNDAYGKKGLASAEHRIKMCELAVSDSNFIMIDPWEAMQASYQRTLAVLARVAHSLNSSYLACNEKIRVMLLCGADLLESFITPGVWIPDQVRLICEDYGIICISRGHKAVQKIIFESKILSENKENIFIVDDFESDISSTKVREHLGKGISVRGLIPDCVMDYIISNNLYRG